MPKFVSIHQNGDSGPIVTVTEAFAKSIGATILEDEPAIGGRDPKPLEAREEGAYLDPPEPSFAPAIQLPEHADAGDEPTTIDDILDAVGDDAALAQRYLAQEEAKGDKARSTLVAQLQGVIDDAAGTSGVPNIETSDAGSASAESTTGGSAASTA